MSGPRAAGQPPADEDPLGPARGCLVAFLVMAIVLGCAVLAWSWSEILAEVPEASPLTGIEQQQVTVREHVQVAEHVLVVVELQPEDSHSTTATVPSE